MEMTETEKEIECMLSKEFLTIKQIALRRGTSVQAVYKILKEMKQKNIKPSKVEKGGVAIKPRLNFKPTFPMQPMGHVQNIIQIHNLQWKITIIKKSNTYKKLIGTKLKIDDNEVFLWKDTIDLYQKKGLNFEGNDVQEALNKGISYWNAIFQILQNDIRSILIKPRSQNIKLVRMHIAETNNEIAKEYISKGERLQIRADEDNKVWLIADNSFKLEHLEFIHSKTAKNDSESILAQLNDFRNNPDTPVQSELYKMMAQSMTSNRDTQKQLEIMAEGLALLISALNKQIVPNLNVEPNQTPETKEKIYYVG